MIRSEIRYDKSEAANPGHSPALPVTWRLMAAILVSAAIPAWLGSAAWLAPLELLLWRPIILGAACMAMAGWIKLRYAEQADQAWDLAGRWGIVGLAVGVVAGLIGYWHMNAAAMPLNLQSLLVYVITLGGSQPLNGPDALMRGFAWGAAVAAAVWSYGRGKDVWRAVIDALGTWAAATLVLILPSIVILVALGLNGVSPLSQAIDLVREFSRLSLNSYWSNLQMLRWFTGFGDQLAATMMLFSAAWVFALTAIAVSLTKHRSWRSLQGKVTWLNVVFYTLAPLAGIIAGWSRSPGSAIDFVAWLVLAFLIGALLGGSAVDIQTKAVSRGLWLALALGSGLLGWPVATAVLVAVVFLLVKAGETNQIKNEELRMKNGSEYFRIAKDICLWIALAVVGLMFVRRGNLLDPFMVRVLLSACALASPSLLVKNISQWKNSWLWSLAVWLAGGAVAAILLGTFAPMALVLFAVAVVFILQRIRPSLSAWLPQIILVYSILVFILVIFLPRWLNPQLVPL